MSKLDELIKELCPNGVERLGRLGNHCFGHQECGRFDRLSDQKPGHWFCQKCGH